MFEESHAIGGMSKRTWEDDPKRLGFVLARYKFVAKLLEGKRSVLEVGCADGFASRVVRQAVGRLTAVDTDLESIVEAIEGNSDRWPITFLHLLDGIIPKGFDAVYALDVLEHIAPGSQEFLFLQGMRHAAPVAVIGMPSLESQQYASEHSRREHVNCQTGPQFKTTLLQYWGEVFLFGMNDETLHTGFAPMCQYRLALCIK